MTLWWQCDEDGCTSREKGNKAPKGWSCRVVSSKKTVKRADDYEMQHKCLKCKGAKQAIPKRKLRSRKKKKEQTDNSPELFEEDA